MSFLSIIRGIGHAIAGAATIGSGAVVPVLDVAAPLVTLLFPPAGAVLGKVDTVITAIESMVTTAKQGALKKITAQEILRQEIPALQEIVSQFGAGVQIPESELSALIDATVAQKNAVATFLAALKSPSAS